MRIKLVRNGFNDFTTELFHICKLFYEDVEWTDGEDCTHDLVITAEFGGSDLELGTESEMGLETGSEIRSVGECWTEARIRLQYAEEDHIREQTERRPLTGADAEEQRRVRKRALGAALLRALQEATGIEQPWGILTGVRPMKLLHNMMMQKPMDQCRDILRSQYLLSEEKVALLSDIGERQLQVIPDLFRLDREVSLYIGIPFCPTKCAYCTFPAYDIRGNNGSVGSFLDGLHYEIRQVGEWLRQNGLAVTTVYWGGGTPTSIEADQMEALFFTLNDSIPGLAGVREHTVEAGRPDTITEAKIEVMKRWKVDRISINPQSFIQSTLDTIGRHHTVQETVETFLMCRELGMNNINMDLILGLPNEGLRELETTLRETEKLMPESLTVHTLSFKRASRMTQNRERYEVAERDEIQDMMKRTTAWTNDHGYRPYYMYRQKNILGNQENVGYSLPGKESLYNIVMMEERQTIIGLGCGAVSKIVGADGQVERFPNPKEPSVYNSAFRDYTERKLRLLERVLSIVPHQAGK